MMLGAILKLIRWKNLLIIAFTQYCIRYLLINGMLKFMNLGIILQLSHFNFFLLSLSTVCIAAAGYIINDYFDTRIDTFNKPDQVVVGKSISRRQAMLFHTIINIIGVSLGFYVAFRVGVIKLGFIHLLSTGLLWFYSTDFKKQLLVGNIVTSLLTAMVPMIVVLYELPVLIVKYKTILQFSGLNFNHILQFVAIYAGFAFLTSLIREIVKDMEDHFGDQQFGCNTVPIAYGISGAKKVVYTLVIIEMILLFLVQIKQLASLDMTSFLYFALCFQTSFSIFIFQIKKATSPKQFHKASTTLKIIMLLGVLYSALYYYLLLY
jgi:4-hydroxybenzoate polyprenyltransferase